ncbi:MAG: SMP-30/gluconolactonase/LRE family protein [Planctomycetes bacterium]|nr:SMP-30/gluconolactonase/LRE family protein [Planctomycetota bacterium]
MVRSGHAILGLLFAAATPGQESSSPRLTVDLATATGAAQVAATWRYHDARLVEVPFVAPGPDRRPGNVPNRTLDLEPKAGSRDFADGDWPVLAPDSLSQRRGDGRICMGWYRLTLTLPERVGDVVLTGRRVAFELVLDDYAEVWVDGVLPRYLGQRGGSLIAGWNAPNRVLLTNHAFAGQQFSIAVLGVNGPLSDPPANYLWIRSARLLVDEPPAFGAARTASWQRFDPRLDAAVSPHATLVTISDGHQWLEGPAWDRQQHCLYFSDIPANAVLRWAPGEPARPFVQPAGYTGAAPFAGREPGSNGLAVDADGALWLCQHGDRRIARRGADGAFLTVVDRIDGRRLNSPNDLLLAPNGDLWFTDPPFGLPAQFNDAARELPFAGVWRRTPDGNCKALIDDLRGPNGLALSPDGRTLYVSDADPQAPRWLACELRDGKVASRRVLRDAAEWRGLRPGFPDGMKVDPAGHLFACGPGGLYVFHPDGTLLGWLDLGVATSNCAFGDDHKTLFLTADHAVLCLRW